MIKVENLKKSFGNLDVLKGINEEIKDGEVLVVIGPSGSGKSTFLRCLNLLERPTSGSIFFEGKNITDKNIDINKVREEMGMVFQSFNLFNNLNIIDNITLAPKLVKNMKEDEAKEIAKKLLQRVGLPDKENSYPSELSGGQKQRIAIARALVNNPSIIFADEPTGALDSDTGRDIMNLLTDLNKSGTTIIMVTHDLDMTKYASRVVNLKDGVFVEGVV